MTACAGPGRPARARAEQVTAWRTAAAQATSKQARTPLRDASCRQVLRSTRTGRSIRLRLSNAADPEPLPVAAITAGLRQQGATLQAPPVQVTVAGSASFTLPAHGYLTTDPVSLPVTAGDDVAVSFAATGTPSEHKVGAATGWCTSDLTGDHTGDVNGAAYTVSSREGLVLEALDVATSSGKGVLAVGDSLTDPPLPPDSYERWTDVLVAAGIPTVNAGIGGNRILLPGGYGPTLVERFDEDVLSRSGIGTVVLLVGTNDISAGITAPDLIDQLDGLRRRAEKAGLRVVLATIPPAAKRAADRESVRQEVNAWIRESPTFVDADRVLRDPSGAVALRPDYDWGDGLHLSAAGQRALGDEVRRVLTS